MKKRFYLFLLLCSSLTLEAATITVTSGADAGAGTLRAAITSAVVGDDIAFLGVTTVTLTSAELLINKNLTINGGTGVTVTRSAAINFRIFNISGATTIVVFNKLSITNGKATGQAGGIQNTANLTLNDCIIANNEAPQGGGIQNDNILTMNRCFVHSNRDTQAGAGSGLVIYGSSTTLNNCVFTNNQGAPAIGLQSSGSLNVTNCTIAKNAGIGIHIANGSATLKNTIVAENTGTPPNIKNNVSASSAYNLIGTEAGNGGLTNGTNNNFVGISPLFANSSDPDGADNVFGTADDGLMPSACSPALNAGNNANAPAGTDIVGNPRTFGTSVDMGAYEFQASASQQPTITLGTIPAILVGATTFTLPYTATTGSPTTYSISGTGFIAATNVALPSSPITVNLSAAVSSSLISFTLTVTNAGGCTSTVTTSSVSVNTPITVSCSTGIATATFNGITPIAPTATTAGVGGKGSLHIYTVPAGVTAVRIDARGAKGGSSPITGGGTYAGGNGGRVQATYAVTSGDVLQILVGGKGGDGSLDNGINERTASGGGGATVVSKGPIGTGTLLLVAGGGGGAGHSGGGGLSNNNPGSGAGSIGAGGASFSAAGGNSTIGDNCGAGGQALNAGGNGGANTCFKPETNGGGYGGGGAGNYSIPNGNAGGGGGGGYVGGNGGGTSGGNGGSSFTDPTASNVTTNNHTDDNGSVTITMLNSDQNLTWTGAVSTDWSNTCNWSPNLLPTATNLVTIPNVTNKPVILSGTTANCLRMDIGNAALLTINSGGTLNILPTNVTPSNKGISIFSNGTLTNNGTINGTTTANVNLIVLNDNTTFNNNGTVSLNTPIEGILMGGPNTNLNNNALGIINFQSPKGIGTFTGHVGNIISNQGIMNFTGSNYFIVNPSLGLTINNSGTIDLKSGLGMIAGSAIVNNLACGKILMLGGTYENNTTGSITTNSGLIIAERIINNVGNFTNSGILKYNILTGTVTNNQAASVIVRNLTHPIFTYGSTFNGTLNGIFTDTLTTVSAGTFVAPFAFTPLATLPRGIQTLYVKITPSGEACSYIVPFSYNTLTSSVSKVDAEALGLQQNRPNPFSQETTIAFTLPETNKAVLTVYDITGRQVFASKNDFKIGYNEVILNKSVFQTTGTYFYRLTTDKYVAVKRLQFVAE
jgi:hypothetical protein